MTGAEGPESADLEANERAFSQARGSEGQPDELPAIDFATFVLSLSHSALVHLGDAPDPSDGKLRVNLLLAAQTIDLLVLLQEKSRNNLTGQEERVLAQALYDLKMRYVEVAKSAVKGSE